MQDIEFQAWPKTPRLNRDITITEKIDGTNAAIIVTDDLRVGAQSRKRLITPEDDNFGFARWVADNAETLASLLGPGRHFGEWWGSGIQRGYGLTKGEKRFSLFNVNRYADLDATEIPALGVVPTLYVGPNTTSAVAATLANLLIDGSSVAPGFTRPEGIVVFHSASQQVYKVLAENDDIPKGLVA